MNLNIKPLLYYDLRSPPVRSVLLLIKALNIDMEYQFVDLFKAKHLEPEFLKLSPLHTVPVLKHGDLILTDSHAILIYLNETFGSESPLEIKSSKQRATILNRLMFNATVFFPRDSVIMRAIFRTQSLVMDPADVEKVVEAYDVLEKYLESSKYFAGDSLTVADFSIVATLSTIEIMVPLDGSKHKLLLQWYEQMKSLEYYESANIRGLEKLKRLIKEFKQ